MASSKGKKMRLWGQVTVFKLYAFAFLQCFVVCCVRNCLCIYPSRPVKYIAVSTQLVTAEVAPDLVA